MGVEGNGCWINGGIGNFEKHVTVEFPGIFICRRNQRSELCPLYEALNESDSYPALGGIGERSQVADVVFQWFFTVNVSIPVEAVVPHAAGVARRGEGSCRATDFSRDADVEEVRRAAPCVIDAG